MPGARTPGGSLVMASAYAAKARREEADGGDADRELEPVGAVRALETSPDAIAATLAEAGPDVCGLQSVGGAGGNLAAELARRLGLHWCWAPASYGPMGGRGAVDRQRDPQPLADHHPRRHRLANSRVADEGRVAAHARIEAPGGTLPVFTTHLTYGRGCSGPAPPRPGPWRVRLRARGGLPLSAGGHWRPERRARLRRAAAAGRPLDCPGGAGPGADRRLAICRPRRPGFTWDHRNGYQANSVIPDS